MNDRRDMPINEQEFLLQDEVARIAVFGRASSDPKTIGKTAADQLMLDLFRARSMWETSDDTQKRLAIIAYANALRNWIRRLSPNDCGDLCLPLVELAGAIKDLNLGVTVSWLRADRLGGTRRDSRTTLWSRAVLAAGVQRYLGAGLGIEFACQEIGKAVGKKPSTIKEYRKRIVRSGDKGATRDEYVDFERLCAWFADKAPAEIPSLIAKALRIE